MHWRIILIGLICAIPLATLVLAALYHFSPEYQSPDFFGAFPPFLTSFASLTAIYALALIVLVLVLNAKNKELNNKLETLGKTNADFIRQSQELQAKIELLSAGREISLILNEEVEFEKILEKSLEITAHFTAQPREAGDVTLFLKGDQKTGLVPMARRADGKTSFETELAKQNIDQSNVREAFEHQRAFMTADGEEFALAVPLVADREAVGVLKVKTIVEGEAVQRMEKVRHLQNNLNELAKIIALAVKTPALYNRAITDPLTGFFSKRHFFTQLQTYMELSRRYKQPLSLVLIDIDHFKAVNDTYGHPVGDVVLKEVGKLVERNIRKSSSAYRYGGEEFAIILPNTPKQGALVMTERLRKRVENHRINPEAGLTAAPEAATVIKITISAGIAEYREGMTDLQQLIVQADNALYQAKQTGRNRVCL